MTKVWAVIPASAGSAFGVYLLLFPATWKLVLLGLAALALLGLLRAVHIMFSSAPILYGWLLEAWVLFLPVATSLLVYAMLTLTVTVKVDDVIPITTLTADQKADVIKYAVGIFVTLAAAFVAGDPAKAENPFWPSAQFKSVAKDMAPPQAADDEVIWYAAVGDCTRYNEVCGWDFKARRVRAKILNR